MLTVKLDPTAVSQIMHEANDAGIPHEWVQINPSCADTTLSWNRDGAEHGLRIMLDPRGTWTAELDLP